MNHTNAALVPNRINPPFYAGVNLVGNKSWRFIKSMAISPGITLLAYSNAIIFYCVDKKRKSQVAQPTSLQVRHGTVMTQTFMQVLSFHAKTFYCEITNVREMCN